MGRTPYSLKSGGSLHPHFYWMKAVHCASLVLYQPHHIAASLIRPWHQIEPTILFMPLNKMTTMMTHLEPPHGCHPHYRHWCHIPQSNAHVSPLFNRPHPRGLSLMTLLCQVCPKKPHNHQLHCHFQGCSSHQALLPIVQGHVLHHWDIVPSWNCCNTIFPLPRQHNHKTLCPPNLPAYAKSWHCLNLQWWNLPVSAWSSPLSTMVSALRSLIKNLTNYLTSPTLQRPTLQRGVGQLLF